MKAEEFIKKLEMHHLFPFSEEERVLAVNLAREYTGRVVLESWKSWANFNPSGFKVFAHELPRIMREKELSSLQEEKQKTQEALEKHCDKAESDILKKESLVEVMLRKVAENRRKATLEPPGADPFEAGFPGRIDPKEGWMIGNIPVF